ncbi:alpha/beta hydrolase [Candidatus Nomurabacteria bacterium]|nr:alpha/beta hydrolase [Candidatus Nomurabacteria bacterium]MCB9827742.1 alpha/beta hydrolase [Candidatus Nomurabacteria bacterium]
MKAIIIPGNGNTDITENWFQNVKSGLHKLGLDVIAENMPDPDLARKEYWLPFIKERLSTEDAILIGHSSGAVAILRYLEENKCKLAILVGACYTDLGDEHEKKSGYFDNPWKWDKIKSNAEKIVLFASRNDPYIPISEALFIKDKIEPEYHEYKDEGHFGADVNKSEFPEIITVVEKYIERQKIKL